MENLRIEPTYDTPEVSFNINGLLSLSGFCVPENTAVFFNPLLDWLRSYASNHLSTPIVFEMKIECFHTASIKGLLDVFLKLEQITQNGGNVKINWYYPSGDNEMIEVYKDFSEKIELQFELIPY